MPFGRGTRAHPGLMMALDRGGSCRGVLFRIGARRARDELSLVWRREMAGTAYRALWVRVRTGEGTFACITFVINRAHPLYRARLSLAETARIIASAEGALGSTAQYFEATRASLAALGIRDRGLERLAALMGEAAPRARA